MAGKDLGAYIDYARLHLETRAVGDSGVERDGASFDTQTLVGAGPNIAQAHRQAVFFFDVDATLGGAETLDVTFTLQDAADDGTGNPDTFADVDLVDVLAEANLGREGFSNQTFTQLDAAGPSGSFRADVELMRLRRHVRVQYTPTYAGGGTPSARVSGFLIFGASNLKPVDDAVG